MTPHQENGHYPGVRDWLVSDLTQGLLDGHQPDWFQLMLQVELFLRQGKNFRLTDTASQYLQTYQNQGRSNGTTHTILSLMDNLRAETYALIKNPFPYSAIFAAAGLTNVTHSCLWKRAGDLTNPEVREVLGQLLPSAFWVAFTHDPTLKSVQELSHWHVFELNGH